MRIALRRLRLPVLAACALLLTVVSVAVQAASPKRVLIIHSFGHDFEPYANDLIHKKDLAGIVHGIAAYGIYELPPRAVIMFGSFIPFFAFREVGCVIGCPRLSAMFFSRRETTPPPAGGW